MSGQAEVRRLTGLEDRKFERVVLGCELDRFATVNSMVVTVPVTMSVPVTAGPHSEQRADGDPAPEPDERDAGDHRNKIPKFRGECDAGDPHDEAYEERRNCMPGSGKCRRTRDFAFRPTLLARDESDRQPVVGDERMKNADGQYRDDEEQLLFHESRTLLKVGSHDVAAFGLIRQRALDAFDLPTDPADAMEELGILAHDVTHRRCLPISSRRPCEGATASPVATGPAR
jgi:hypothetical protein